MKKITWGLDVNHDSSGLYSSGMVESSLPIVVYDCSISRIQTICSSHIRRHPTGEVQHTICKLA